MSNTVEILLFDQYMEGCFVDSTTTPHWIHASKDFHLSVTTDNNSTSKWIHAIAFFWFYFSLQLNKDGSLCKLHTAHWIHAIAIAFFLFYFLFSGFLRLEVTRFKHKKKKCERAFHGFVSLSIRWKNEKVNTL